MYKLLYASRLLDCGLASQAFHYCEVVGQAILKQTEPFFVLTEEVIKVLTHVSMQTIYLYHAHLITLSPCIFIDVLSAWFFLQLADRLRHSEGQFSEAGISRAEQEPDWLKQLRARHRSLQVSSSDQLLHGFYIRNIYYYLHMHRTGWIPECGTLVMVLSCLEKMLLVWLLS